MRTCLHALLLCALFGTAAATDGDFAGWLDNIYNFPPTILRMERMESDGEAPVLSVEVLSRADLFRAKQLTLRSGKVYRIDLEGRVIGQVEQLRAQVQGKGLRFRPAQWPIERDWHRYSLQVRQQSGDGDFRFNLTMLGVGTFQVRSFQVTELPDFALPPVTVPFRGELLPNGDFALGADDWYFRLPRLESTIVASAERPSLDRFLAPDATSGRMALQLPAGAVSLINAGTDLVCPYGRTYCVTVRGQAAADDVDVFFIRPGMSPVDSERLSLTFVDGVATAKLSTALPRAGIVYEPEQHFAFRLRHLGKEPARIETISLREDGPGAPDALPARAGVELLVAGTNRDRCAVLGQPVTVRVRTDGLAAGSDLAITVNDERGRPVRRLPATVATLGDGRPGVEAVLTDMPPGWFRVGVELPGATATVIDDDFAVVLPADPQMHRSGFLGTHVNRTNTPSQLAVASLLGLREMRCWDFGWPRLQPKAGDPITVPPGLLEGFAANGIEPMVLLNGTPDWASTSPDGQSSSLYPPRSLDDWTHYVRQTVTACGKRVRYYQIWNEPNGHALKVDPKRGESLQQAYTALARAAYPVIKAVNPDAVVVAGATAGSGGFIVECIPLGLLDVCDVVSYHAYGDAQKAGVGAAGFTNTIGFLRRKITEAGKLKPIWDCESGFTIEDGPEGLSGSMLLAKGLIARQAAGFARHYIYNACPREYPGHFNFSMLLGFNSRPLITMPLLATWDRVLGDATYVADLGDDAAGRHVYQFHRADGATVIAGWISRPEADAKVAQELIPAPSCLDAFGRSVPATTGTMLQLDCDLRYFTPQTLAARLGG